MQYLQSVYPHLGRRECVHPSYYSDTFLFIVCCGEKVGNFLATVCCTLVHNLDGQTSGIVQSFNHNFRVAVNLCHCVTSIKKLCSCYEPHFKVLKCFNHSIVLLVFLFIFLSVICVWPVFAVEMLFHKQRVHCRFRVDTQRDERHFCHLLHYNGVIYSVVRVFSP